MATVKQHYGEVLAEVYFWMSGGFDRALGKNVEFFPAVQYRSERIGYSNRSWVRVVDFNRFL